MYRNEYARGGPVLNSAIAAIEFALWDICGKALGSPSTICWAGACTRKFPPTPMAGMTRRPARATSPGRRTVVTAGYRGLKFDPFWGLGAIPIASTFDTE